MKSIFYSFLFSGLGLLSWSCKPNLDVPTPSKGEADFSRYVAFGNSLTAGVSDGGLYREVQLSSYPSILAGQLKAVGGGEFEQPLFSADEANGTGYLYLHGISPIGLPDLRLITTKPGFNPSSLAIRGVGDDGKTPLYTQYQPQDPDLTPQNLGMPFIRLSQIASLGLGSNNAAGFNPFFERLSPGLQSYASYAVKSRPTFFTCWLGSNDVLGFAGAGGDLDGDGSTDVTNMTDPQEFEDLYKLFLDSVRKGNPNTKGLLANISNVSSIPFFTTFKPSQIVAAARLSNPLVDGLYIQTAPEVVRKATDRDLVLLTTQAVIGRMDSVTSPGGSAEVAPHGFTIQNPLSNNEVLDSAEVEALNERTARLNEKIQKLATEYDLAHWDANEHQKKISEGMVIEGVTINASLISGNAFSLDGTHPTPMGYAIVANEMIKAINAKYNSRISTVSVTRFRGVRFP